MPTKKRRIGFIPRIDVLKIIDQLSLENNLSNSKIINILVEEALHIRGIYKRDNKTSPEINEIKKVFRNNQIIENNSSRYDNNPNQDLKFTFQNELNYSLDHKIYEKFIMFLQFQEKMKNTGIN